jgi:hypothetical protein
MIFKLAEKLSNKYAEVDPLELIKREIINAYNLYVSSDAKEPVIQMLADANEPFSQQLKDMMDHLVMGIDEDSYEKLFNRVDKILGLISDMKKDPGNNVRNWIHDNIRAKKQSEVNYREHLKKKFELVLHRLSSILEKQAKELKKHFDPTKPLSGEMVDRTRGQLSKDKILMFLRTPAAEKYNLDKDIFEKVTSNDPEMRSKVTTLINAIDRGHTPQDGPEVSAMARERMLRYFDDNKMNFEDET